MTKGQALCFGMLNRQARVCVKEWEVKIATQIPRDFFFAFLHSSILPRERGTNHRFSSSTPELWAHVLSTLWASLMSRVLERENKNFDGESFFFSSSSRMVPSRDIWGLFREKGKARVLFSIPRGSDRPDQQGGIIVRFKAKKNPFICLRFGFCSVANPLQPCLINWDCSLKIISGCHHLIFLLELECAPVEFAMSCFVGWGGSRHNPYYAAQHVPYRPYNFTRVQQGILAQWSKG